MGQSYEVYNLVTAPYLQVNSHFTPYYKTASQTAPTGTMIGDLGIKIQSSSFYVNSNGTIAQLNGADVSMEENWTHSVANGTKISNKVNGNSYEISLKTPDVELIFIRKVYMVAGLEAQFHFDYKAKLLNVNKDMHGYKFSIN